jgi:hypothetical protein
MMENDTLDRETAFYIKALEPLYRDTIIPDIGITEISIERLLHLATVDNALDHTARLILKKYEHNIEKEIKGYIEEIVSKGDDERRQLDDTILDLKRNINTDYLIFKTYKGKRFQRIGNDIDILVEPDKLEKLHKKLLSGGYRDEVLFPKHEKCIMVKKPEQINLHIQSKVHWCGKEFLDNELIWKEPRTVVYAGHELRTNNKNADFLIHLAHLNFEHPFFRLSELLYLYKLCKFVDFELLIHQTERYKWKNTFLRNIELMNNIHVALYEKPMTEVVPLRRSVIKVIAFPYEFSRKHMILSVIERRITYYLLGRVFKLTRVLLTGETCSYTQPPERKKLIKDGKHIIKESVVRGAFNDIRHRLLRLLD